MGYNGDVSNGVREGWGGGEGGVVDGLEETAGPKGRGWARHGGT